MELGVAPDLGADASASEEPIVQWFELDFGVPSDAQVDMPPDVGSDELIAMYYAYEEAEQRAHCEQDFRCRGSSRPSIDACVDYWQHVDIRVAFFAKAAASIRAGRVAFHPERIEACIAGYADTCSLTDAIAGCDSVLESLVPLEGACTMGLDCIPDGETGFSYCYDDCSPIFSDSPDGTTGICLARAPC